MKKLLGLMLALCLLLTGCFSGNGDQPAIIHDDESLLLEEEDESDATNNLPDEKEEVESNTISLVIPEGFTLARIGMTLEELGVCTTDEFINAAQTGDFNEFSLVAAQNDSPDRCYKLEGYLFPDTYEIYKDEAPAAIIRKMLSNNESKIGGELRAQVQASGFTFDEIIALASIIEKEAYENNDQPVPLEMPKISSVLHNRLKDGMMLQCNVTATYVRGAIEPFVDNGFDRYNDFYNTYHTPAIPVGAICNPGLDAIKAAVSPADTNYMFFITGDDKNFYYAETWEEHSKFVSEHLSDDA